MKTHKNTTNRLLGLALTMGALSAQAQLIDEVDYRREGNDAVLQIRLITEVQYQRAAIGRSGDLTQAFYLLLPTRQTLNLVTAERRLSARRSCRCQRPAGHRGHG